MNIFDDDPGGSGDDDNDDNYVHIHQIAEIGVWNVYGAAEYDCALHTFNLFQVCLMFLIYHS